MSFKGSDATLRSFFDQPLDPEAFWKQIEATDFRDYPKYLENEFYLPKPKSTQQWESCTLSLQNNFLVLRRRKACTFVEYVDLEEHIYKVRVIQPQEDKASSKYKHAFSLCGNGKSFDFYCKTKAQLSKWLFHFQKFCAMCNFYENYEIIRTLGSGGYGRVRVVLLQDKVSKGNRAGKFIKILDEKGAKAEKQKIMILNEIRILRRLDHPHIVKMFELYELENEICIVMEYVEGEMLLNYISKMKRLYEKEAALLMKQLFLALNYLHGLDIIHRDVKSENIMLMRDKSGKVSLKLIDFGLSAFIHNRDATKRCGTPGYVAPEILNNEPYNYKVDIYSAGIVMFMCLTGKVPFYGENFKEIIEKNKSGLITYSGRSWNQVSREGKELIQKMLEPSPVNRIVLEEAMTHVWFQKNLPGDEKKYLSEIVRMDVAEEKKIQNVPVTALPSSRTHFVVEHACRKNSTGSTSSLINSMLALPNLPSKINTLYKLGPSKEFNFSLEGSVDSSKKVKPTPLININLTPSLKENTTKFQYPSKSITYRNGYSTERKRDSIEKSIFSDQNPRKPTAGVCEDDETRVPDETDGTCADEYAKLDINKVGRFYESNIQSNSNL